MIDEIELIEELMSRKTYLQSKAEECANSRDIRSASLFGVRYLELSYVIESIIKPMSEPDEVICSRCKHNRHSSRDSFPCSECNKNYISQYEHE